jgi:hypothetical protein
VPKNTKNSGWRDAERSADQGLSPRPGQLEGVAGIAAEAVRAAWLIAPADRRLSHVAATQPAQVVRCKLV